MTFAERGHGKPAGLAWRDAERVLAVRLDNLGDVLMTSPALRALKQGRPGRRLTVLASSAGAAAAARVPEVDAVIELESPWMPGRPAAVDEFAKAVMRLHEAAFDAAVIFTSYSQSPLPAALLCWQAGIPLRLAHCRENPYHLLTDWIADPEPHELLRHEVRRQLDLVAAVGCLTDNERLSFRVDALDMGDALAKLEAAGIDPRQPWMVVHPGASAESRRYPVENFGEALQLLADGREARCLDAPQILLTGAKEERAICEAVRDRLRHPAVSLAGMLSLGELAAVIAPAVLLIANNSGPVHIAAALGTPVVDIYALTNPQHAPWKVPCRVLTHDVPCRYCYRSACPQTHHACLRLLEPARVAAAARELLDQGVDRVELLRPARRTVKIAVAGPAADGG